MAKIPRQVKPLKDLDLIKTTNILIDDANTHSNNMKIPHLIGVGSPWGAAGTPATEQDAIMSLRAVGNILNEYQPLKNAFTSALVNRIAKVYITSKLYSNKMKAVKKGVLEYGETIEDVFVKMAEPYQFDQEYAEEHLHKRFPPNILSAFHSLNFQKFYPMTISEQVWRQAFLTFAGLSDLYGRCIEQVYTGAEFDDYEVMLYQIARRALDGEIYSVTIPTLTTTDDARGITATMIEYANNMNAMELGHLYNVAGVDNFVEPANLVTILTNHMMANIKVEVLALAFHMDQTELVGRMINVPGFGVFNDARMQKLFANDPYTTYTSFTQTELDKLATIQAVMFDENWFMDYDNLIEMGEPFDNGMGLYNTFFYHTWRTYSTSPFANAIMFTTLTSTITAVSGTTLTSLAAGTSARIQAVVVGTGFPNSAVEWEISGENGGTKLVVDANDPTWATLTMGGTQSGDVTIRATAKGNTAKYYEWTVTPA